MWGYSGKVPFTTAEKWLGTKLSGSEDPRGLVLKYLAAFGPATVRDVQTWSGRTQLKQTLEEIKGELRVFRDENSNELLDVPDAPRFVAACDKVSSVTLNASAIYLGQGGGAGLGTLALGYGSLATLGWTDSTSVLAALTVFLLTSRGKNRL